MKYFDKDFFKFTLGFLCIISISLFVISFTTDLIEGNEGQTAQPASAD